MITPADAANALNYLLAARAVSVVDDQAQVWADYLNHEVTPSPQAEDLLPACRRAIRDWSRADRAWQVDVERYAAAIRTLRHERVQAVIEAHGQPQPEGLAAEPEVENAWRAAWIAAIHSGAPDPVAAAWQAIGRTPPPPAITATAMSGRERARRLAAQLADRARA